MGIRCRVYGVPPSDEVTEVEKKKPKVEGAATDHAISMTGSLKPEGKTVESSEIDGAAGLPFRLG